ncbi:hypothetical protein [Aliarcobacter cryaerophilus]|uniref:hypothetical protein n=1 Tax=Aliarcobacter cryaerophilus TaxID=28198 RepID=UPI003DA25EF9
MSSKPILFNTKMVKAILDGRKTQTRRAIKIKNKLTRDWAITTGVEWLKVDLKDEKYPYSIREQNGAWNEYSLQDFIKKYSHYKVGDVLYVRETWCYGSVVGEDDGYGNSESWLEQLQSNIDDEKIFYKADIEEALKEGVSFRDVIWKPSIHMPKEYARIFLKVINVRVERLQDISEDDLEKEGIVSYSEKWEKMECKCTKNNRCQRYCDRRLDFINLWNSTAKDGYKWEDNPYVFVYEFERIEKQ